MNVTVMIVNTKRSVEKYVKYPKTALEKYYKRRNNTWGNHVSQEEKTGIEKIPNFWLDFSSDVHVIVAILFNGMILEPIPITGWYFQGVTYFLRQIKTVDPKCY